MMLIDAGTPKEALLVVVAIDPNPNQDGLHWTEFYPVDRLLALRYSDKLLQGHPLLDLATDDDTISVMGEALRPAVAAKLFNWCKLDYFVALRRVFIRGKPAAGRVSFTWRRGEGYLTKDELMWLKAISASGFMVYEQLAAIEAVGRFCQGLYRMAMTKAKKPKPKPKIKRKVRRQLEVTGDIGDSYR